jgi:NADH-quinone oxidoreductase subunit J
MSLDVILFLVFAFIAVVSAVSLVVQTHPIASALSLVGVMGALAVLYLLLGGEFIAAAQMIVYAGAIMVLFVFVIMLLNAGAERRSISKARFAKWFGIPLFAIFVGLLSFVVQALLPKTTEVKFGNFTAAGGGEVGAVLFTRYVLPFEVTSILILVAILGAVVLARKEI